jgi:hypothetical protein
MYGVKIEHENPSANPTMNCPKINSSNKLKYANADIKELEKNFKHLF